MTKTVFRTTAKKPSNPVVQFAPGEVIFAEGDAGGEMFILQAGRVEIINFPPAERAKLAANASKHWTDWAADKEKRGLPGKALLEFVQTKIKEYAK